MSAGLFIFMVVRLINDIACGDYPSDRGDVDAVNSSCSGLCRWHQTLVVGNMWSNLFLRFLQNGKEFRLMEE
ncbi:MAM and LDL-receptor class A domain-containing protein [Dirofilaria immitis]